AATASTRNMDQCAMGCFTKWETGEVLFAYASRPATAQCGKLPLGAPDKSNSHGDETGKAGIILCRGEPAWRVSERLCGPGRPWSAHLKKRCRSTSAWKPRTTWTTGSILLRRED